MAKLARLMPGLPEFIDPEYLAETKANLAGEFPLAGMQRLQKLLHHGAGLISASLDFERNDHGNVCITGHFSTVVGVVCQRCLEPFETELKNAIHIGLIREEGDAKNLADEFEPLVVAGKQLSLATLLEEEILLSLPLAAAHPVDSCPGEKLVEELRVKKENPFSVLKDLNLKDG